VERHQRKGNAPVTGIVLAFWAGVLVFAVFPDRSERAAFARWVRQRAATIPRSRDDGRHYGHPLTGRQ